MRRQTLRSARPRDLCAPERVSAARKQQVSSPAGFSELRAPSSELRGYAGLWGHCSASLSHTKPLCVRARGRVWHVPQILVLAAERPPPPDTGKGCQDQLMDCGFQQPGGFTPDSLLLGRLCPLLWAKQKIKWEGALDSFQKEKNKTKTVLVRPFQASFVLTQPG